MPEHPKHDPFNDMVRDALRARDGDPGAIERSSPDVTKHVGLKPHGSDGPGTWDRFSAGVKDGLGDFVSRVLYGEPGAHNPSDKPDKGIDR